MGRSVSRAAVAGVMAGLLSVGTMASPAMAGKHGKYEVVVCHCKSMSKAKAAKAAALKKGWPKVVIQVIASDNVEVELANGYQTKSGAEKVASKARKMGIHCYTEKEGHGFPSEW